MKHLALAFFALVAIGCGESQKPSAATPAPAPAPDAAAATTMSPELMHQQNQLAACTAMCTRLTECAVEDTRKNSPETLENIDVDALKAAHTQKCVDPCAEAGLSGRQLQVIEDCMNAGGDCQTFVSCLDAAQAE